MERLKERGYAPGSLEADASELLRASEPYAVPVGLKRRVRERLVEGRSRSWLPLLLRPALVAAGVLLVVGAAAAVGRSVLKRAERAQHPLAPAIVTLRVPAATSATAAPLAAAPQADSDAPGAGEPAPDAPTAAALGAAEHRPSAERGADSGAQSEAALVYGAAKALHNSGDPALAAKLLDDYARRYPRGALSEEALALSIDVAVARGDGRAKQLATRYLARYPHGHFQAKAERVLAQ